MAALDYPVRAGAAKDAYRQHIIDVLRWKLARNGTMTWDGRVDEHLGKRGLQAAKELENEGVISLATNIENLPSGMYGDRNFGRSGWVNGEGYMTFTMAAGVNFPQVGY